MFSTYLLNRNGRYHFRLRIPSDLSNVFPQREIVKSLKTSNLKTARESSLLYLQGISQTFSLLRSKFITAEQAQERLSSLIGKKEGLTIGHPAKTVSKGNKGTVKLSKVVATYISDKEHEWSPKTKMECTGIYRLIIDLMGDLPVKSVGRTEARDLRDRLLKLPANVYKIHPRQTPLEVLKMVDSGKLASTPMSITSVNKHISRLSTLMIYCVNEGLRKDNPVTGMSIRQKRRPDEERKAYDREDIKKIRENLPRDSSRPERYWVPLICMLTGLRLDEACQLYKEDITMVDGVWCIDVNDSKDRKLKNLSSKRIIPIHPSLLEMGLIDHVERCREGGRLWENLTWCKVNGYSNSLGKWYQRFNRQNVTDDPHKTFHSLRHSFADTLKQLGVQESLIAELMGHANGNISTGRYGKRYQPKVLLEVISKLQYDVVK